MTCENFRSRIAEMFDSEHIANDMWKHIAECDNCRNYYAECCATVNFITPKAKIPTPNFSTKKSRRSRWHFSRHIRRLSYAALTIMAALLAGIAVYHYDLSDTAHAATQAFSKASLAMSEAENFTATIMVRTRPQDNFNFIDIDAPFVEHTLAVTHSGNRCLWNISKGNHHVVCDGLAQYQWQDDAAKAYISPNNENIIGIFNILINISQLMDSEMAMAKQSGNHYTIAHSDSTLTLTIKSAKKETPNPILKQNNYLAQFDNEREYVFDIATNRLRQMRYCVVTDGKKQIILESSFINYDSNATAAQTTNVPTTQHEWIDLRSDIEVQPDRLAMLQNETPTEAATRILTSIFDQTPSTASEALLFYDTNQLASTWKGYSLIGAKETILSEGYAGVYVVMEVLTPDNRRNTIVMALRNDNPLKIWRVDGGL